MSDQIPSIASTAGTLIGGVTVDPPNPAPGQPVHIEVLDPSGKRLSDTDTLVTVMGVAGTGGYYQFPTEGSRTITVTAKRGDVVETAAPVVDVSGETWKFRPSLANPDVTVIPLLQAETVPGRPYSARFTVGSTDGTRRLLAAKLAAKDKEQTKDRPAPPAVSMAPAPAATGKIEAKVAFQPTDVMGKELAAKLATLPAESIRPLQVTNPLATTALIAGKLNVVPEATSYEWDFGDGTNATTQLPTVTHDYLDAVKGNMITHSFHVTCRIVHDNVTVTRTLTMESAYGRCRQLGVIVPPVTGDAYATFQRVGFASSLVVTNLEPSEIVLTAMAVAPVSDDPDATIPAPVFTDMKAPIVLAGNASTALGVYVSPKQLHGAGSNVNGFVVHYRGQVKQEEAVPSILANEIETAVPVRFSHAFRIRATDSGVVHSSLGSKLSAIRWDLVDAAKAVKASATEASESLLCGDPVSDPATHTIAMPLAKRPTTPESNAGLQSAVGAGMANIAQKVSGLRTTIGPSIAPRLIPPIKIDPNNPPPVAEGNECYPDNISDSDAASATARQLVCQATGETHTVTVPGSFQNALQGDIILSPMSLDSGDLIAALFSTLTPPQYHTHSGIMTKNFFEITHCTASTERYGDHMNSGIPMSIDPSTLEYGWPGAITQSVDDATNNRPFIDPNGKTYTLRSFNPNPQGEFHLVYPLVIKPLPEHEEAVRPTLRAAADLARSKGAKYDSNGNLVQQGGCYYSFYSYTNPARSAGFTSAAGPEAGWANGLVPAVCSSFVWMCLKNRDVPLVTTNPTASLSDFSAAARAAGAQVGPPSEPTPDGLTFYPANERVTAGMALRRSFMSQALDHEGVFGQLFGGALNELIAGPIADQLLNDFAFGNPNMVGSSAWQSPGNGNAISPDNITFWNPPYYGYAEPLQYLPPHTETYTVRRWKRVITWGSVRGTVNHNGRPVPNAHVWIYLGQPGGDTYTDAGGRYELSHVPIGSYQLKAQAVINTNGIPGEQTNGLDGEHIEITTAQPNTIHDIELHGLPSSFRKLDLSFSISGDHRGMFQTWGAQNGGPYFTSIEVNPGQVTRSWTWNWDYDGGGYYTARYTWDLTLAIDLSISAVLTYQIVFPDGSVQHSITMNFNVPEGESRSGWTEIYQWGPGYFNGPVHLTFSATNNQQTG